MLKIYIKNITIQYYKAILQTIQQYNNTISQNSYKTILPNNIKSKFIKEFCKRMLQNIFQRIQCS